MIPNYLADVEQARKDFPQDWADAHTGNANTEGFIRKLAARLHAKDPRVACNGKRGNPNDLSDDALNCLCDESESAGRTPDGKPCVVIDVIGGAGGPNPTPTWAVFTTSPEANGAWVKPGAAPIPPTPPTPPQPVLKPREQFYAELGQVNDYYAKPEGLQRPGGMVKHDTQGRVIADVEALGSWGYDLMLGATVAECIKKIRHSDEWKQKHPGEQP